MSAVITAEVPQPTTTREVLCRFSLFCRPGLESTSQLASPPTAGSLHASLGSSRRLLEVGVRHKWHLEHLCWALPAAHRDLE